MLYKSVKNKQVELNWLYICLMYEKGVLWLPEEHKKFFRVLVTRHIHMVVHCYLTILTIFLIFDAWEITFFDRFILNITKKLSSFQSVYCLQADDKKHIHIILTDTQGPIQLRRRNNSNVHRIQYCMFTEFKHQLTWTSQPHFSFYMHFENIFRKLFIYSRILTL